MGLFITIFLSVVVIGVLLLLGYYLWEECDGFRIVVVFIGLCLMFSLGVYFMMKACGF